MSRVDSVVGGTPTGGNSDRPVAVNQSNQEEIEELTTVRLGDEESQTMESTIGANTNGLTHIHTNSSHLHSSTTGSSLHSHNHQSSNTNSQTNASPSFLRPSTTTSAAFDFDPDAYIDEEQLHLDDTDIEDHGQAGEEDEENRSGADELDHDPQSQQLVPGSTGSSSISSNPTSFWSPSARFLTIASWFALLGSVLSMSATGPMFLFLQRLGIPPILACVWRNQCTCLFLLVPAIIEWRQMAPKEKQWEKWRVKGTGSGKRKVVRRVNVVSAAGTPNVGSTSITVNSTATTPHLNGNATPNSTLITTTVIGKDWHVVWYLCGVSVVWSCSLILWVSALPFTSTARASLLTSIYPLLLVLWLKFGPSNVALSSGEILGVIVSFLGIATCEVASVTEDPLTAHHSNPHGGDSSMLLVGDALCLASAFFIAADIVISKKARQVVPLFTYTLSTCFLTLILLAVLSMILEDTLLFSMHPTKGVFGWLHTEQDMIYMNILFGILEGAIGLLGFNFAIKYIPHLVFSSVQLLDPGVTGILSWTVGLESFPSLPTFLGIGIVTIGIAIVVVQQHKREGREKNKKMRSSKRISSGPDATKRSQYQMVQISDHRTKPNES